ncbi:MAG: hypothetical protein WD070_07160 [Pirellulaceae bacterium]
MWQRGEIWNSVRGMAFVVCALWLAIAASAGAAQDRSWDGEAGTPGVVERVAADAPMLKIETNSIILAVLCFAVGFAACLLVVRSLLPSLVHVQCVEIVREYLQHTRRESDVRVVVLDREPREPLRQPRRVTAAPAETTVIASRELPPHLRVDRPTASASPARAGSSGQNDDSAPDSMLSQIYEQNLHLRDQLREQGRSVRS